MRQDDLFAYVSFKENPNTGRKTMVPGVVNWNAHYLNMYMHITGIGVNPYKAAKMVELARSQDEIVRVFEKRRGNKVSDKSDMYSKLLAGTFGNRQVIYSVGAARHWFPYQESHYKPFCSPYPLWALRYKKPGFRQWSCYDLTPENVWPTYCDWVAEGADPKMFNLTPMMPDDKIVVQGEIARSEKYGWIFRVSHMNRPMNVAFGTDQQHHKGPAYWLYLKQIMDPSSYDDLQELFDTFPDSIVEFSTYSINVGDCPGRNTLIWEVRNY